MADLPKRSKAAIEQFKNYKKDWDKIALKRKAEGDEINKKVMKTLKMTPKVGSETGFKLVDTIKKGVDDLDQKLKEFQIADSQLNGCVHRLSDRVTQYHDLLVGVVLGLVEAQKLEQEEMEKQVLQLLSKL